MRIQTKKMIAYNLIFIFLFIAAYYWNRSLMLAAVILVTIFIMRTRNMHYCIGELLFLLPFSSTMTLSSGTTSLFMLPKIAVITVYLLKSKGKLHKRLIGTLLYFVVFTFLSNIFLGNFPIIRLCNLVLWFFIAYIVFDSLKSDLSVEGAAFILGVIASGFIGLIKDYIPQLASELASAQYLNEATGVLVERFAGLWNDPNGYTFFVILGLCILQWALTGKKISSSIFAIGAATISFLGLATLSKSCFLMMVLFWICFIFLQHTISIKMKVGTIIFLGVCLVVLYSNYSDMLMELVYRFTQGNKGSNVTLASITTFRSNIWESYLSAFWSGNILFGNGIDAPLVAGRGCHNTYIQLLYEWGILGSTVYVATWISLLKTHQGMTGRRTWFPFLLVLILAFSISCVYIEFLYFLLPLSLRVGEKIKL